MGKTVILTGLRSNSELHLGNYLGALLPMVKLQQQYAGDYQINIFVPDIHSFTTPINHQELYDRILNNLRMYVAAGIDLKNKDVYIYRQSHIPAHSELTVILNNFAFFGELSRMTQFKEKSKELRQKEVSAGLFDYPVMMTADILLYGAEWVPVGEDQQQHIEFTRVLGMRFNNKFGNVFKLPKEPKAQVTFAKHEQSTRIRSLRNPEKKMSKSSDDPAGTILLTENPQAAAQKVLKATTDSLNNIQYDFKLQPGVSNLLQILALLSDIPLSIVIKTWEHQADYSRLKTAVAQVVEDFLTKFQAHLAEVDLRAVEEKLIKDEAAMQILANKTLISVQQAVGLRAKA
ncbi:MAG: tryptophan--tRNA ligase [Candidatus Saccharimonadales bacterium]